ncbi:MAG: MBL fold metallo-hydrolase [Ruminococcus sp.]|nr:MBL fold metallo-hydrolase [Ruminococcus sp.]
MILIVILILTVAVFLYIKLNPVFGGSPDKADKADYSARAENYTDEKFTYPAEYVIDGLSEDKRISEKGTKPADELPYITPDFKEKPSVDEVYVTWLGHSVVLIQMHGLNILIDPVFSDRASPVSFVGPERFSEPFITADELPDIDIVLLSHDHYDHLDMETIKSLDSKTECFIVPLGVENHLERWGVSGDKIRNMAWWEETDINGLTIACAPARHYSGRYVLDSGNTLFASWILKDGYHQIFESGDSGFGGHFEDINKRYGDFDFVMIDCAQYDMNWHTSHMFPEESANACEILGAEVAMPIHWGAYSLSTHGWDDPPSRFVKAADELDIETVTPMPGETMNTDEPEDYKEKWWESLE